MTSCAILMRMKSTTGESCYFKDDSGRFSADLNKAHTLKVKIQTAYKLTFECPKHMRVISVSMDGAPVAMEDAPGQRPDAEKMLCVGIWRTDVHFATKVSKRVRIETVMVLQVDGLRGPDSDERHLLKSKLLVKFYNPDYGKYTSGHALGGIRFRCHIGGDRGGSKITSVTFADALHVEQLRRDELGDDESHVTPVPHHKQKTKPITINEKEDPAGEGNDENPVEDVDIGGVTISSRVPSAPPAGAKERVMAEASSLSGRSSPVASKSISPKSFFGLS